MDNSMPNIHAGDGQGRLLVTLERLLAIDATELTAALDQASQLLVDVMSADKVDVFLHDQTIDTLVALGTSDTPMSRHQRAIGMDHLPIANRGRAVEAFQTGTPYHSGQVNADPHELIGIKEGLGVQSAIYVPLVVEGRRRGVLGVSAAQQDHHTTNDLHFLEAVAHWVGILVHRAELVERIAQNAAEQSRRATAEELITVLAHDLKNYLAPLATRLSMIHRRAEREERTRDVRDADSALQAFERLRRLVADMLDVERLERGLFQLSVQRVNIAALANETANVLETPQTRIHVSAPDELGVEADPDRIRQVLENLLSNAVNYAPAGVPIEVRVMSETREDREWAVLSVRDEGPGIPPELLPSLFNRNVIGSASAGLGLGLYLARGIAEAHGGRLTVESSPGVGTTFRLELPMP